MYLVDRDVHVQVIGIIMDYADALMTIKTQNITKPLFNGIQVRKG